MVRFSGYKESCNYLRAFDHEDFRSYFRAKARLGPGLFLESPGNFLGPESCFVFVVFPLKI